MVLPIIRHLGSVKKPEHSALATARDMELPRLALPAPRVSSDWRRAARFGYIVVVVCLGGFGLWASLADLSSAVIASGIVSAESSRKTIQHLEGGIVEAVLVRDGELVQQGQVLYRLEQTQARTNLELLVNQRAAALAREARLLAERDNLPEIAFPPEVQKQSDSELVRRAVDDERANFRQRRATLQAQLDVMTSRAQETGRQIEGLGAERSGNLQQSEHIESELVGVRSLYAKNLVALPRLKGLERELSRLTGVIGRADGDIARLEQNLLGIQAEKWQANQQFQQTVANDIVEVRRQLAESQERLLVAEDQLKRTVIRAPQAGTVQGMKYFTVGGVIRSGDAVLEIAPINEELVIRVKISPMDGDAVIPGLSSQITFPSFHARKIPLIMGELKSVSRDQVKDEKGDVFFSGEVRVDQSTMDEALRTKLVAGMPAEVFITTGARTALEYFLAPLMRASRRAMRDRD